MEEKDKNINIEPNNAEDKIEEIVDISTEEKKPPLKKKILKEIREWVVSLVLAVVIVYLLQSFAFTLIKVDGRSMTDTLQEGERLFVTVYDVKFGTIDRDEVVICHYPGRKSALLGFIDFIQVDTNFVKRVVAIPGDQVYRENGVTHVVYTVENEDGTTETIDEALDEGCATESPKYDYEPYTLGEDEYFVVGDHRSNSHDSRYWNSYYDEEYTVGPITKDMIVGHVRSVIWPLNSIRSIEKDLNYEY